MFSRSRPETEGAAPEGTSGTLESSGGEAARAFDQVLNELQPPGTPTGDPDVAGAAASVAEHAATLRATRDAHQEAQAMLAMATESRREASEEAEQILLEARDAAERTRQELSGWAAAQRAKVDALASDMVESANRDADTIRAEALRTSMAEAEETARLYVAEAAARAQEDADVIRGQARSVLTRAIELSDEAAGAIGDLTMTVSDIMTRLQDARTAMAQLLDETPLPVGAEDSELDEFDGTDELDETDGLVEDDLADELDAMDEGLDPDDISVEDFDVDEVAADDLDADLAAPEPDAGDPLPDEQLDRQLGSMFRRHGHRGD